MLGRVTHLHRSDEHLLSKSPAPELLLVAGLGVKGDAHFGATVQHRSRVAVDPSQPNLRQVHLLPGELHDELESKGFKVGPGDIGENITTRGVDLLSLATGTVLCLGSQALIALTGFRNPCRQLEGLQAGLLNAVIERNWAGDVIAKAGVMGVVLLGGVVREGDRVEVQSPPGPGVALKRI